MPTALRGKAADPKFRTERARKAARASWTAGAVINRFLAKLDELTPEQIETVRRALPLVEHDQAGGRAA